MVANVCLFGRLFLDVHTVFTTCGKAGFCLKHVPKIKVWKKTLYMSYKFRDKSSKMAVAIETIVTKIPFSKWNILAESRKDHIIAMARDRATRAQANGKKPVNQTRNLWLVTKQEKQDYAGIRVVMNVPLFITYATCIDQNFKLTGLCGH